MEIAAGTTRATRTADVVAGTAGPVEIATGALAAGTAARAIATLPVLLRDGKQRHEGQRGNGLQHNRFIVRCSAQGGTAVQ